MAKLHVHLFGKFGAMCGGQVLKGLESRKIQELFCYLLLYHNHSHPRETLASMLWGSSTTEQSKKSLRHALWQLKAALAVPDELADSQVLLVEPDWVQINVSADLWVDATKLERAFTRAQRVTGETLDRETAQVLREVVELYQGDLLEGFYQDWCLYERQRFQNMYLSILDKLVVYAEASQEYETGLTYGMHILRYDRARERTYRQLMRLHYLAGDRATALRQYEHCVAALGEELGVKPSKRTVELYEQIKADQLLDVAPAVQERSSTMLPDILDRLKRH